MYLRRGNVNTLFPSDVVSVTELISIIQADSASYNSPGTEVSLEFYTSRAVLRAPACRAYREAVANMARTPMRLFGGMFSPQIIGRGSKKTNTSKTIFALPWTIARGVILLQFSKISGEFQP